MKEPMIFIILVLVILIMGAIIVIGTLYPSGISATGGRSYVEITATGEASASPTEAIAYLTVNGSGSTPKLALDSLTTSLDTLNITLLRYTGNASQIKTVSYSMNKVYNSSAYEAQEGVSVTLRNISNVSPMLEALSSLSNVYVSGVSSMLSDIQSSRLGGAALLDALDNATIQARVLTGNATLTIRNITEENYFVYPMSAFAASSAQQAPGPSYSAGSEEVVERINVVFSYVPRQA